MRVGIVSFTDVDSGIDLANALAEAGADVTYYSSRKHASLTVGDFDQPEKKIHQEGLLRADIKVHLTQLRRMRDLRSYFVMQKLAKRIQEDGMELVHILIGAGELWTAVLANLIRQIPVVSTIIIPEPNIGEYPPPRIVVWINRLMVNGSDMVIVNGKNHIEAMQRIYNYPKERVSYIPLGPRNVFLKWIRKDIKEKTGTLLFVGRINKHKGLEYLVKAQPIISKCFPEVHIIVAGLGDDLERCRAMIQDPGVFEIHDGYVPGELMAEFFQRSSLVMIPYVTAATSAILMTAYVFGKAVVSTRVGSLPEYVQDGITGILVDAKNEEQLAQAVIHLLTNDRKRAEMGQNAKSWINNELGWKKISEQTLHAYQSAINYHQNGKHHHMSTIVESTGKK